MMFSETYKKYTWEFVVENYRMNESYLKFASRPAIALCETEPKNFICRDLPYCEYDSIYPVEIMGMGEVTYSEKERYFANAAITLVGTGGYKGYKREEFEYFSNERVGQADFAPTKPFPGDAKNINLSPDTYILADMGKNHVGLFEFELDVKSNTEFFILFDEILVDGVLDPFRLGTSNVFTCIAKPGTYKVVSAEPYGMRYLKMVARGGEVTVRNFRLIEVAFPVSNVNAQFVSDDKVMKKIYDAAVLTFRNNTTDI